MQRVALSVLTKHTHVLCLSLLLLELLLEAADEDPGVYDGVGELLLGPLQQSFPDHIQLPVLPVDMIAQMMVSSKGIAI